MTTQEATSCDSFGSTPSTTARWKENMSNNPENNSHLAMCHTAKQMLLDLEKAIADLTQEDPERMIAIDIDALEERLEESRWRGLRASTPCHSQGLLLLGIRA